MAVDPRFVPLGTPLFLPELVGVLMPDGSRHDGCVRADDTGGNIRRRELDFFVESYTNYKFVDEQLAGDNHVTPYIEEARCAYLRTADPSLDRRSEETDWEKLHERKATAARQGKATSQQAVAARSPPAHRQQGRPVAAIPQPRHAPRGSARRPQPPLLAKAQRVVAKQSAQRSWAPAAPLTVAAYRRAERSRWPGSAYDCRRDRAGSRSAHPAAESPESHSAALMAPGRRAAAAPVPRRAGLRPGRRRTRCAAGARRSLARRLARSGAGPARATRSDFRSAGFRKREAITDETNIPAAVCTTKR